MSTTLFNKTNITYDNFCATRIKYIMCNVQDYSVLYNNSVRLDVFFVCDDG